MRTNSAHPKPLTWNEGFDVSEVKKKRGGLPEQVAWKRPSKLANGFHE